MYNLLAKLARYTETFMKLLASFDETVTADNLGQLYTVLVAHMNFCSLYTHQWWLKVNLTKKLLPFSSV